MFDTVSLLIAPKGIETLQNQSLSKLRQLLIAPKGIETDYRFLLPRRIFLLLIAPKGIETQERGLVSLASWSFNRT